MALHFMTTNAKKLLAEFEARIKQNEPKGSITTWERLVHDSMVYFTHKADSWAKLAYFRPTVGVDRLTFNIIKPKDKSISSLVYAYYHGHLTETFLNHFDELFEQAISSAKAEVGDNV
jgi:hypothetical protein